MQLIDIIRKAAIAKVNEANAASFITALSARGARLGLDRPHRLAQLLPQLMHESADFRYDREIWGPTAAQERYDTRTDLGNTPARDGDGKKNMGRGPIQLTGGANIRAFHAWCVKEGLAPPNFIDAPDLINTDPWEGLSALWYWDVGNPERRSLNRYADDGNAEMITRRINGGLNGYADRLDRLTRVSLVLLGYGPEEVRAFQAAHGLEADGQVGARTRQALHAALLRLVPLRLVGADPATAAPAVAPAAPPETRPTSIDEVPHSLGLLAHLSAAIAALFGRKPS